MTRRSRTPTVTPENGQPPTPGQFAAAAKRTKRPSARMLLDTHNPYKPSIIDWPRLEPEARDRLVGLPIWDIAVQTEGKARLRVLSYARTIADPLLRQAIELDGFEEGRHKEVLSNLVEAYGIRLAPEPRYLEPRDPEWAFMVTGFSECIDSFFAFGLFALAKRAGFFPPALVDTFEPVMQEEGRHILFFVNWVAWHRRNLPLWRRPIFSAKIIAVWLFLVWERIGIARGFDSAGHDGGSGAARQQFYPDRQQSRRRRRSFHRRSARCLPRGERPPPLRLRPAATPAEGGAVLDALGPSRHATVPLRVEPHHEDWIGGAQTAVLPRVHRKPPPLRSRRPWNGRISTPTRSGACALCRSGKRCSTQSGGRERSLPPMARRLTTRWCARRSCFRGSKRQGMPNCCG